MTWIKYIILLSLFVGALIFHKKFKHLKILNNIYIKVSTIIIIIFILIFSTFTIFRSYYLIPETPIPNNVQEKILTSQEVNFDQLIDGEWDNLIILSPYCDLERDSKTFNINLKRLANTSIQYHEGQSLFIFCKKDKIESYFYIESSLAFIDHEILPYSCKISKADAIFLSIKEGTGQKLTLKNNAVTFLTC